MKDSDSKVPDQKELEKELNEYLDKKYGDRIRLVVPMFFPKPQTEEVSKEEKGNPEMLERFEALLSHEKMALKESILNREAEFKKRYGIVFREGRIDLIVNRIIEKGYDVNTVFEEAVGIQRQVEEFEMDFKRRNGIYLQFSEEAIDRITEILLNEDGKGTALSSRLSKDYEYGLKLISDKTGQKEFIITREAVNNPEEYLDRTIREINRRQSDQRLEPFPLTREGWDEKEMRMGKNWIMRH